MKTTKQFTIDELADRWMDRRAVQNMMGRFVYSKLLKLESTILNDFWADRDDISLGVNEGYYAGREAVKGYYDASYEITEAKTELIRSMYPDFLAKYTHEELHGVGTLDIDALTSCVIEQSEDGETMKGLWYVLGCDSDITEYGPYSFWTYGFMAGDFIKEGDDWKIWHLQDIEDMHHAVAKNWMKDPELEVLPEFASVADLKLPEPNVKEVIHERYSTEREFKPLVRIPEPYVTFADTFSYGV